MNAARLGERLLNDYDRRIDMAGRTQTVELVDAATGHVESRYTIPDYAPRAEDVAWCERELGDVPVRVVGETCHDNPASWAGVLCESLGRDQ